MTGEPVLLRYCSALAVLALFAPLLLLSTAARSGRASPAGEDVGVYRHLYGEVSKGIYRCELDLATASCPTRRWLQRLSAPRSSPSHPNHRSSMPLPRPAISAARSRAVSAFALIPKVESSSCSIFNRPAARAHATCWSIARARTCWWPITAGGSAGVLPIKDDGSVEALTSFIQHRGSSVNRQRQEGRMPLHPCVAGQPLCVSSLTWDR